MQKPRLPLDRDRHFRTDHLQSDLKGRSVRGGAVTMAAQGGRFALQTGSTIILARLLTPEDYGLFGMVAAVTGFISLFKDLGLSKAIVQRPQINHAQVSTLFWVNVAVSVLLFVATAAIAPLIAGFYGEPRLVGITLVLGIGYVFGGLTVQHQALLNRQMRFTSLAAIDLAAMTIGIIVAIVAATLGTGYWALVLMQLALFITNAIGVWILCDWRPGLPRRTAGVRSMLAFGGNLTGFNVINYFARNLDNVLIGRYWGAQQLGLYAKAYQLLLLPIRQINAPIAAVAIPTLSRLTDSPQRYRQAYLRVLEKLAMITIPGMAFMIVTADWLILLLLGPQWRDASQIFALLGFAALIQPVSNTTGWLFTSQGRTHHLFQWGIVGGAIAIASIIIGLPWGALGVAASYAVSDLFIRTPLLYWFVGRTGPVKTGDFYRAMIPSAIAAAAVMGSIWAFRQWSVITDPLTGLAIALGMAIAVSLLVLGAIPAGRAALYDFRTLLLVLLERKRKPKQSAL